MHPKLYSALVQACALALRIVQPFDSLHNRLTGATDLPPLWLRRNVGPIAGYKRSQGEIVAYMALRTPIAPRHTMLDIGCGTGMIIPDVLRAVGTDGRYVGFDIHAPSLDWARRQYGDDRRVELVLAELQSDYYSPSQKLEASEYRFPAADNSVDRMLAKSVLTHLLEPEAAHYVNEIARVLAPDGLAVVSVFLLDVADRPQLVTPALSFDNPVGRTRVVRTDSPLAAVGYPCAVFGELVERAGLRIVSCDLGWWFGGGSAPNYQDLLVLARRESMSS